jgi:calcium-dependent protein kinase
VKSIAKDSAKYHQDFIERELDCLRSLDHPNIVKFYEIYQDRKYFHIVMEYCSGGDLLDLLCKQHHLSEVNARRIMFRAFAAIRYLHENKICHRDIKPDNFLFSSRKQDAEVKLIDFGLSRRFGEGSARVMRSKVGTPQYVAPEIFSGRYDEKCDAWSL